MERIVGIAYFILGLVQLAAIMSFFDDWVGLHWLLSGFLAFFICYIPLVGTVVGMYGAVKAWGWSWMDASMLFLGPFVVIVVLVIISSAFSRR